MSIISSTHIFVGKDNEEEVGTSLSSVTIGGRPLCNLRFADDIDILRGNEEEKNCSNSLKGWSK